MLYSREKGSISGLILENNIKGNYIKIIFKDKGKWIICFNIDNKEDELIIINSEVYVPNEMQIIKKFTTAYKQLFGDCNINYVVGLIKKAQLQKHGTMLVFSDHAFQESKRLNSVGYEVICSEINGIEFMEQITAIDGSILIDPKGNIKGIGMILDGITFDECKIDNSRGSRYNSAIKYTYACSKKNEKCIAVVISEDKDVNIIVNGKQI